MLSQLPTPNSLPKFKNRPSLMLTLALLYPPFDTENTDYLNTNSPIQVNDVRASAPPLESKV